MDNNRFAAEFAEQGLCVLAGNGIELINVLKTLGKRKKHIKDVKSYPVYVVPDANGKIRMSKTIPTDLTVISYNAFRSWSGSNFEGEVFSA